MQETNHPIPEVKFSPKFPDFQVEIEDNQRGFFFRLLNIKTGEFSDWCGYREIANLGGHEGKGCYAATEYYLSPEKALFPVSADEILATVSKVNFGVVEKEKS